MKVYFHMIQCAKKTNMIHQILDSAEILQVWCIRGHRKKVKTEKRGKRSKVYQPVEYFLDAAGPVDATSRWPRRLDRAES